jgi:hypothetical protein
MFDEYFEGDNNDQGICRNKVNTGINTDDAVKPLSTLK